MAESAVVAAAIVPERLDVAQGQWIEYKQTYMLLDMVVNNRAS